MPLINYCGMNLHTINAVGCEPVRLIPGVNEVSESSLEAIRKHPAFNALIENKKVIVMEIKSPDGKRSIQDMLEIIPKTFDTKLLKKIISQDGREVIVEAAKAQLDTIVTPKKDDKEGLIGHFK